MSERPRIAEALLEARVAPTLVDRLAEYGEMLLTANRRFNLTGAETPEELVPHILDSLTIAPYVGATLVDVGSGGGLPAVPLAIALGVPVTMIESNAKKAGFLRSLVTDLGLQGDVLTGRAETLGHREDLRERFETGTARAVAGTPTVLELVMPFVCVGGQGVFQRGRLDDRERNAAADAATMLGGELAEEIALEGERRILLVQKTGSTSQRFPRRTGVPEKRPLCL